jgi:hypothetical protein
MPRDFSGLFSATSRHDAKNHDAEILSMAESSVRPVARGGAAVPLLS